MSGEFIPAVICLTDNKPVQCKDIVRSSETTADLLPNYTDLRFPYKGSSMLCPCCGKPLAGIPKEDDTPKETSEEETKGKKAKRKPKPWEIHVDDVGHEKEEDQENCPLTGLLKKPNGKLMALVASAHQITWIRAWKEKASRPDGKTTRDEILENLEKDGTLPKLVTEGQQEHEDDSNLI